MNNESNQTRKDVAKSIKDGYNSATLFKQQRETDLLKQQIVRDIKDFGSATAEISKSIPIIAEVANVFSQVKDGITSFITGLKRTWEFSKSFTLLIGKSLGISRNRSLQEVEDEKRKKAAEATTDSTAEERRATQSLTELAERGLKPGSIYTHDIHAESSMNRTNAVLDDVLDSINSLKKIMAILSFAKPLFHGIFLAINWLRGKRPIEFRSFKVLQSIDSQIRTIDKKITSIDRTGREQLALTKQMESQRLKERRLALISERERLEEKDINSFFPTDTLTGEGGKKGGFFGGIIDKFKDSIWPALGGTTLGTTLGTMGGGLLTMGKNLIINVGKVLFGPAGFIAAAIWAIVDGFRGMFEFGGIEGFFGGLLGGVDSGIKGMFSGMGKWALIGAGIGSIVPGIGTAVGGVVGALFGSIMGFIGGEKIAKAIKSILSFIWKSLTFVIKNIKNIIVGLFGIIIKGVTFLVKTIGSWILKGIGFVIDVVKGAIIGLVSFVIGGILNIVKNIGAWVLDKLGFKTLAAKMNKFDFKKAFKDVLEFVFDLPKKIASWLGNGIKKVWYEMTHFGKKWEDSEEYKKAQAEAKNTGKKKSETPINVDPHTGENKSHVRREEQKLQTMKEGNTLLNDVIEGIGDLSKSILETLPNIGSLVSSTFSNATGKSNSFFKTTTIKDRSGKSQTRLGGSRNWRNNNPGNIEYGEFAIAHGAIGSDGRFAIFPDMETGYAAADALLSSKNYRGKSITSAINRWAPKSENNVKAYLASFKRAGIDVSKSYESLSADEKRKFLETMYRHEGGQAGTIKIDGTYIKDSYAGSDQLEMKKIDMIAAKQKMNDDLRAKSVGSFQSPTVAPISNNVVTNNNSGTTIVTPGMSPYRNTLDDHRLHSLNYDYGFGS